MTMVLGAQDIFVRNIKQKENEKLTANINMTFEDFFHAIAPLAYLMVSIVIILSLTIKQ